MLRSAATSCLVVALVGCATAAPPPQPPVTAQKGDDDVTVLKDRVSRLERRLADVDAKLGLLLAQRASPPPVRRAPDLGPRDLIVDDKPPEEASLGARSIDLGSRRSIYEEPPDPVIKVSPEEDSGPPIVIKITGDAPRDAIVRSAAPTSTGSSGIDSETNSGLPIKERYDEAQAHVKAGEYLEALAIFEDITSRHGHHDLADNSVYWAGFCHQARGDHKLAIDVWQRLPMKYPKSPKVPDALFGMAVSEEAIGEPAVAETLYEQLIAQYPRAEKVRDAKKALSRLRPK